MILHDAGPAKQLKHMILGLSCLFTLQNVYPLAGAVIRSLKNVAKATSNACSLFILVVFHVAIVFLVTLRMKTSFGAKNA